MNLASFFLQRGWDCYARWYDFLQPRMIGMMGFFGRLSFEEFQKRVVELANLREGDKVLDVACGTGRADAEILEKIGASGELVSVDFSAEMLKQAKAQARRLRLTAVRYQKADVERLSAFFEEGKFDAVISVNGLPQFLHPDKALKEMVNVLRPGGRFAASTINRDRAERKLLLWPFMQFAPRLWHIGKFRRRLRELGLVRVRCIEEGIMIIITGQKRAS